MKTLSALVESVVSGSTATLGVGVANHYTPINNIITNVRNLFAPFFGLVVEPGEDGISIKIHNHDFVNPDKVYDILYKPVDRFTSVASYIEQQGLTVIKLVNLGHMYVVYFCPADIKSAEEPEVMNKEKSESPSSIEPCPVCKNIPCTCDDIDYCPCSEMKQYNIIEAELHSITEAVDWNGDEEMEDKTKEEVAEIINMDDKVKAASEFAEKLSHVIQLPENFYIKAVKDSDGRESIALRQKIDRRRPFGKKVSIVRSLINIFSAETDGIWVDAYVDGKDNLDETTANIINEILNWLGVEKTADDCVFAWRTYKDDNKEDIDTGSEDDDNVENANAGDNVTANGNINTNIAANINN